MAAKTHPWALFAILLTASLCLAATTSSAQRTTTGSSSHKAHHSKKKAKAHRLRGQKAIDGDRVRQIQLALIHEHYLKGSPSGKWDDATQSAMRHYQSDQGWQSKTVPDARALIRLGLGPDQEHLLNPESAMTSEPVHPHAAARTESAASSTGVSSASSPVSSGSDAVSTPAVSVPGDPTR
jgi:peptidoglycan hydrolase-like protein with peptidoglycan-binding domain